MVVVSICTKSKVNRTRMKNENHIFCACLKPGPGFPTAYVVVCHRELRWEVIVLFRELRWEVIVLFRELRWEVIVLFRELRWLLVLVELLTITA
jgi:hypothetical protein